MKTAREIIADSPKLIDACRKHASALSPLVTAEDIIAALAAEGFSIVETGRDPVTIEACAKVAERATIVVDFGCGGMNQPIGHRGTIATAIRALSRSAREGKAE